MQVRCLGRDDSPGGGHGNPLQYSCLENPTGRGTWQAAIHRSPRVRDGWARTQSIAKKAGEPEWCLNYFWERACSVMFVSVTCQECGEGAPCLGLAWGRKISETGHLRDAASDLIVCYRKCWGHMLLLAGVCESWYAFCDGLECVCGYVLWWAWCVCVLICFYDGLGVSMHWYTFMMGLVCVCVDRLLWWAWGVCVCLCVSVCVCVCNWQVQCLSLCSSTWAIPLIMRSLFSCDLCIQWQELPPSPKVERTQHILNRKGLPEHRLQVSK